MIIERRYADYGRFQNEWLNSRFHFNFADYHDAPRRNVGPLIVWNDDIIKPQTGFDMHSHRDMEIITYVRRGAISHVDHLGNKGRTEAGDVQVMCAGTGISHAEYNYEDSDTEIFQIWVLPNARGLEPGWEARRFPSADQADRLVALASGEDGINGALQIHQDATLYGSFLTQGANISHALAEGRSAYAVVARGEIAADGRKIGRGDALIYEQEKAISLAALEDSEILLFDLPEVT